MAVIIPLRNDLTNYVIAVELSGKTFGLELFWNYSSSVWHMSISDAAGEVLVSGVPLLLGFLPALRFKDDRLPKGQFSFEDSSNEDREATFDDVGERVRLLYFEPGELL